MSVYISLYILVYMFIQSVEAKSRIILKSVFFSLISPNLKKKCNKSKLSSLALLFKHIFIKIQPIMSEQEKKFIVCLMLKPNHKLFCGLHQAQTLTLLIMLDLENKTNATSHQMLGRVE